MNGKIVTGAVDDESFVGALGQRVHRQQFLSNFRSANPGFVSLATGSVSMPPGASGFPSEHDVSFDLLPMTIGQASSNLFYWDGVDTGGDGLDISDVNFIVPMGVSWDVFDANFNRFSADGTDQLVSGGLIQTTSADIDPSDGIDTGAIHKHLVLQLSDDDGNAGTSPAEGIYMIAWQARSEGFETSDPFLFVHRTSTISNAVRDLAADWAAANLGSLISPPGLPGDFNENGVVDAADYTLWQDTFGQTGDVAADGNEDHVVDAEDFELWKTHFGLSETISASTSNSVPEPSVAAMLFGMLGLLCPRWPRRRSCVL